jgi:hypothetical protein
MRSVLFLLAVACASAPPIPPPDPEPLFAVEVSAARGQGPGYRIAIEHGGILRFTGNERTGAPGERAKRISDADLEELERLVHDIHTGSLPKRSTCGESGDLAWLILGGERYVIEECGTAGPDEDKLLNKLDGLAHRWIGYPR